MKKNPVIVKVNDKFQTNYHYLLVEKEGENFDEEFQPELTPAQMLKLGVFGGRYLNSCRDEFPKHWFKEAKLSSDEKKAELNFFGVNASQPLTVWQKKGWIYQEDPRGWFQWYCRYFMGRRLPEEDRRQIKRWKAMKRHIGQIKHNCLKRDVSCRPKQRQALLHWAYDSRKI